MHINIYLFILIGSIIICLNAFAQQTVPLYADSIPNSIGVIPQEDLPTITAYPLPELAEGNHHLLFDCTFSESADINVKITVKLSDGVEKVQAK